MAGWERETYEFTLLGPLSFRRGGVEVTVSGDRRRSLLTRLLVDPNTPLSPGRLADDIWEGDPPPGYASTLQSHVLLLRQILGHDRIRTVSRSYELVVDDHEIDARLFEKEATEARNAWLEGDTERAAGLYDQALGRWSGPAIADVAHTAWAASEVVRLEQLKAGCLEGRLRCRSDLGFDDEVVAAAEAAIARDPLREGFWTALMLALYRSGRQSDAIRAFRRLAEALAELGLEPGSEAASLEVAILQQRPELDAPPRTKGGGLSRLVDRLITMASTAAERSDWHTVAEAAEDALAVAPRSDAAAELLKRAHAALTVAERRGLVTLLFCDIVGWTPLAEESEPEVARDVFARYRQLVHEPVVELGGSVLQYQGDGVVACFGHDSPHGDDARRAVLAGLLIRDRLARERQSIREAFGVDIHTRIAVHSGTMVVTVPRPGSALEVIGAPSNVVARLQAEANADTVVISDITRHLVEGEFEVLGLGTRSLKGVSQPMEICEVLRLAYPDERLGSVLLHSHELIGRRDELDGLVDLWGRPAGDTAFKLAVLRGPAGIGKSRLVAELALRVDHEGASVLTAGCSPYHNNVALWPMASMLARELGVDAAAPDTHIARPEGRLAVLSETHPGAVPLMAWLIGVAGDLPPELEGADPTLLRKNAVATLIAWLEAVALRQRLLLVLEDAHWADPSTVELIGLLSSQPRPNMMVVVTTREEAPPAGGVLDVPLGPLGDADALDLVDSVAGPNELTEAQRAEVVKRSGGVPLFLEELTRATISTTHGQSLPLRLQEVLGARLEAAGADLGVAQVAATLGQEFDLARLSMLEGEQRARAAVGLLEAVGIVEPCGAGLHESFRFTHVLLCDTAYETQPLDRRRSNHERVARALLAEGPADAERAALVARHFDLGGAHREAVANYLHAGQLAQEVASFDEARGLLDRAVELLERVTADPDRDLLELGARLLRAGCRAAVAGFAHPEVLSDYERASELCGLLSDRPEVLPAEVGLWAYLLVSGRGQEARRVIEHAASRVLVPGLSWFYPEVLSCLGYTEWYAGRLPAARAALEESWQAFCARPPEARVSPLWSQPQDPLAVTAIALACVAWLEGDETESGSWKQAALQRVDELPVREARVTEAFVNVYIGWLEVVRGRIGEARQIGARTMELCDVYGLEYFKLVAMSCALAVSEEHTVDPAELDAVLLAYDLVGHRAFRGFYLGRVARNYANLGDRESAQATLDTALATVVETGEHLHEPDLLRLSASLKLAADPAATRAVAAELVAAMRLALDQGAMAIAADIGKDLDRIPDTDRPPGWRQVVAAVDRTPAGA